MLWLLLIHILVGLPAVLFYVFVMCVIKKRDKIYSGTYYILMKYSGVVDITVYVINCFFLNLMHFKEMALFYRLISKIPFSVIFLWLTLASFHALSLNIIFTTIHRLFLLRNPLEGDEKFRPYLKMGMIFIPVCSLLITAYIPFQRGSVIVKAGGDADWIMDAGGAFLLISIYFAGFHATVLAILTLSCFILVQRHRNMAKTVKRLIVMSLFTNMIQLGFAIIMGLKSFIENPEVQEVLDLYVIPLLTFIACMGTPWIHLIFNKSFRGQVLKHLGLLF